MGGVAVVTDSTADLPLDLAEDRGLRVVPMSVSFGDESFISRITITDEQFYERLRATDELPSTSQPAPAWFEEAYADCADEGLDAVVSLHVSGELSGTLELARRLAAEAPLPVEVVDSRQVGGGLALAALAANRMAMAGRNVEEVGDVARRVSGQVRNFVIVDTLDYLRRGGRLSGTQALVGNVLRVKPILTMDDGNVEVCDRARTWAKAMDRVAGRIADAVGDRPTHVMVSHALAEERAEQLLARVGERLDIRDSLVTVIGPIVGTHTGPGTVAVAAVEADDR